MRDKSFGNERIYKGKSKSIVFIPSDTGNTLLYS